LTPGGKVYKYLCVSRQSTKKTKTSKALKQPKPSMISSRAQEYITRFTTKGVQKKTILKKIVEYREECKGLYHEADAKKSTNYRAEESKKEYLRDMIKRIECLAEARDYLQEQIDNKAPAKKAMEMSAKPYAPPKEAKKPTKPKKLYYDEDENEWDAFDRIWGRT